MISITLKQVECHKLLPVESINFDYLVFNWLFVDIISTVCAKTSGTSNNKICKPSMKGPLQMLRLCEPAGYMAVIDLL